MSEYGDLDNDIDWDEVILAADAAALPRGSLTASIGVEVADLLPAARLDDELQLLYDIIAREDANIAALTDIEDLGMQASSGRKTIKTLYEQFRRKRGFLSVTDLSKSSSVEDKIYLSSRTIYRSCSWRVV